MMASTLARGMTIIENAATEPEVVDLANFLNSAGARISGAGTSTIRIEGVSELGGTKHTVIPDRIEAGTLLLAGAITRGEIIVKNLLPEHLKPLLAKLTEAGIRLEEMGPEAIRVCCAGQPGAVDLEACLIPGSYGFAGPVHGFLTASGTGLVDEMVFENRFKHVGSCNEWGQKYKFTRAVQGQEELIAAPVRATDCVLLLHWCWPGWRQGDQ